jgi:hypothetical protein
MGCVQLVGCEDYGASYPGPHFSFGGFIMNKGLCACFAVVALLVAGAFANAAQPSASKMSQMGLSGAKVVSDSVAMQVRGTAARSRAIAAIVAVGPSDIDEPLAVQLNISISGGRGGAAGSFSLARAEDIETLGGAAVIAAGSSRVGRRGRN